MWPSWFVIPSVSCQPPPAAGCSPTPWTPWPRHDRIVESLARNDAVVEGELRIAASTAPGEYLLPGLLSQFTEIYPLVRPRVAVTDSASATAQVANGQSDLGFVGTRAPHLSLEWTEVAEDELGARGARKASGSQAERQSMCPN